MSADYFAGGARDELTLRANRAAWDAVELVPRVLVDVSGASARTTVLGREVRAPILVAPTAFQRLAHPDGEAATARGSAGTVMCLSTLSTVPVEEVVAAHAGPTWFQLYVYRDRGACAELVARVVDAGCSALVVTADAPILGTRYRDLRSGFHLRPEIPLPNARARASLNAAEGSALSHWVSQQLDAALTWKDLGWLAGIARIPIVLKGVLHPDDARLAVEHGCAALVVSNHGGRQLDGAIATARALPAVAEAVGGRAEVYVDGGIRCGVDALRARSLGARAVMVGRPVLWGLAVGGAEGVRGVMDMLEAEYLEALRLAGG